MPWPSKNKGKTCNILLFFLGNKTSFANRNLRKILLNFWNCFVPWELCTKFQIRKYIENTNDIFKNVFQLLLKKTQIAIWIFCIFENISGRDQQKAVASLKLHKISLKFSFAKNIWFLISRWKFTRPLILSLQKELAQLGGPANETSFH